ncbi:MULTISPECIES: flagellar biosynthetic protein FliR [Pantoea]|jgi:flagellar biosynthetic protein FliR|uniref:Flagellar biosynthetic protein FliR n=1 Tax=Pantoea piersonii TaxID=2364647 RepID=A0AAJ5UBD6_9GAMM|nr:MULTISPECIES: flagellar biosynthetic protein FliR [Pantoea]HCW98676.1 flagellar biosynthetic protein FliR [Pantoea sp.]MBZ6385463.1 flagellar type III secretion system protein FliR [Pantoea piersonii]MBZ6398993.1 flagellar type III secretion system protein FliR [Pantoea piersonii]MBZ6407509.1 flagellar type III secretion system protein FliR [Pantoea piersonii]MBZ6425540.1 flagellar type III secretion system protein FliR [Pantoea piersonii]
MVTLDSSQLVHWVSQFFWPLARMLALFATAPLLSERAISNRVKIGLAALITWIMVPTLPSVEVTLFSPAGFWLLLQQMLIGVGLGFTMQLAFAAVRLSGEVIGLQMGLSFATFFDPGSRLNMPVLARFLDMLAMLLFLTFNGHLWLISLLADSFHTLPIGGQPLNANAFNALVKAGGLIFLNGMMLALPLIVLLLLINLVLGLLNRVTPQLSIFAVGFPITLTVGILTMGLMMPLVAPFCEHLFSEVFDLLAQFLSELSHP